MVTPGAVGFEGLSWATPTGQGATGSAFAYTCSLDAEGAGVVRLWTRLNYTDGTFTEGTAVSVTLSATPQRYVAPVVTSDPAKTVNNIQIFFRTSPAQAVTFRVDAGQVEQKAYATTYADGSLGVGYAWTGAAHASTSTRASAYLSLGNPAERITPKQGAIAVRFRTPAPVTTSRYLAYVGSNANNGHFLLLYLTTTNHVRVYTRQGTNPTRIAAMPSNSVVPGQWHTVIADWDEDQVGIQLDGGQRYSTARIDAVETDLFGSPTAYIGTSGLGPPNAEIADWVATDRKLADPDRAALNDPTQPWGRDAVAAINGSYVEPEAFELSQFVHIPSWSSGDPIPTPPAPGTPVDTGPPQTIYTRDISLTQWAALARWVAGMAIPTDVILSYIKHLGHTATTQVNADLASGIVTITTTGTQVTDTQWADFDGTVSGIVETSYVSWESIQEAVTTPVPTPEMLISFWFFLELKGYEPVSIFHEYGDILGVFFHFLVVNAVGPVIPVDNLRDFVYRAPTSEEVRRLRVVAKNNPPDLFDRYYVAPQVQNVLAVETGFDLSRVSSENEAAPSAAPSAKTPVITQERRAVEITVTPIVYRQSTEPTTARDGDVWINGTVYKKRVGSVWQETTETATDGLSSTTIGRNPEPDSMYTVAAGHDARAVGVNATAIGSSAWAYGADASAFGEVAMASGDKSTALGRAAYVPVSSPRSNAIGNFAAVPDNTPDRTVIAANDLQAARSNGAGETRLILASPDGTEGIIAPDNDDILRVNGKRQQGELAINDSSTNLGANPTGMGFTGTGTRASLHPTSKHLGVVNVSPSPGHVQGGRVLSLRNTHPVGPLVTVTLVALRVYWIPVWVGNTVSVNGFVFYLVTPPAADTTIDMGFYSQRTDYTMLPNARQSSSALRNVPLLASTAAGAKVFAQSEWTYAQGQWVWAAFMSRAPIAIRGSLTGSNFPSLRGGLDTGMNAYVGATQLLAASTDIIPADGSAAGSGPANTYLDLGLRVA